MASSSHIPDDAEILRRFSDRPRAGSLKLRDGEDGISCNLRDECPLEKLLEGRPDDSVYAAPVQEIRNLGLDVVRVDEEDNPGHCEIRSDKLKGNPQSTLQQLAELFKKGGRLN